jgi:EmrB/QacA subfamily drug resistance transporter
VLTLSGGAGIPNRDFFAPYAELAGRPPPTAPVPVESASGRDSSERWRVAQPLASLLVQQALDAAAKRWILVICCLAQFMVILDVAVVNVALPSIRNDLHFSAVDLQWVVNAYALTFAGFLLLGGRAADLLGQRRVFIFGLALFGLASLAGGLSQGQGQLVVARAIQGLGGAVVAPVTLSILTTTFAEGSERNSALSLWGAMGAVGGAAGGLVGGILTEALGWEWILFINVPIALGIALAARRFVRESPATATDDRHYDVAGALTVTAGLVALTFGIVRTEESGWGSATTLVPMGAGLLLLGLFIAIEGRWSRRPLVPLSTFSSRSLSAANIVVFFLGCAVFAMWYFVSLYLQQVLGYSAIRTGIAFLPMTFAVALASTVAGRQAGRIGPGRVLTAGMTLVALGMAGFSFVDADGSYLADVLAPSLVTAAGIGLSFVPVTIAAVSGVERAKAGLASGLVNTSRQFGGSLGLAVFATVASSQTARLASNGEGRLDALTGGFQSAFLMGAGFAAAGAVASLVGLSGLVGRRRQPAPAEART